MTASAGSGRPGTLLRCLQDGARMLRPTTDAKTPRQLQGEMWVLLMDATEALHRGQRAVARFLKQELRVSLSGVASWASRAFFGEPSPIDDDEALALACSALWEALCKLDTEFEGLIAEPLRRILHRQPTFWRSHPRLTARGYFVSVLKSEVEKLVTTFGIRDRLGTGDLSSFQVDRRAATRRSKNTQWVRAERIELGPETELAQTGLEDETLLVASLETIAKTDHERTMLRLMALAGPTYIAKDAYEMAGVSEKQFQAFQKRARRKFPQSCRLRRHR